MIGGEAEGGFIGASDERIGELFGKGEPEMTGCVTGEGLGQGD
jgi:hypothetical protein